MSFPRWKASIRALFQGGVWRWVLAFGFAVVLGGGAWVYDVYGPQIRAAWPQWKAEGAPWIQTTVLWVEFLASVSLSIAVLCWFTALLFCLLCAAAFSLPRFIGRFRKRFASHRRLERIYFVVDLVVQRDRLLGTVLNLLASAGALAILAAILERPVDVWDIGIQVAVAAAIELIVLEVLFAEGRFRWPIRKAVRDH